MLVSEALCSPVLWCRMQKIHVSRNGKVEGPYSLEVIQEKILANELSSADWAWWKGQKKWASIKDLPGLRFPSDDTSLLEKDAENQSEPIPRSVPEPEKTELSPSSSAGPSDQTTRTDKADGASGITVPDFRVNPILWISAGWFWLTALAPKALLIHFVALLTIQFVSLIPVLLLSSSLSTSNLLIAALFSVLIPAVVAPWSWIIMEQFRNHPVRMEDFFNAYLRAPVPLLGLGLINQLPFLLLLVIPDEKKAAATVIFLSATISLFLFYSMNLLVDKRISLLDSLSFSFQAVNFQFVPMLLYLFLIGSACAIGFSLFSFLGFIILLIAYASTIFAYLWVFSRDSLPNSNAAQQNREPADQ